MEDVEPDSLDGQESSSSVELERSSRRSSIFSGLTAWFSKSVRNSLVQKWIDYGGIVRGPNMAMFFFSESPEEDDTQKLYKSEQYLCDCLAIFHASYIDGAIQARSVKNVCIGKYFLPPQDLYQAIKEDDPSMCYAWEAWVKENDRKLPSKTLPRLKLKATCVQSAATSAD